MPKHGMILVSVVSTIIALSMSSLLFAHCDTLSGPVIMDAKRALEISDLTPVLKWIKKEYEAEIKRSFQMVLEVRSLNTVARELADRSFFETVVRLHRAGEGAPYTGLTAEPLEAVLAEADKSLQTGSLDVLSKMLTSETEAELRHRFKDTLNKKKNVDQSVESGREYVEAYVRFVHYVEALHRLSELQKDHSD